MVTDSLDGIIAGLYDEKDRGFFRYSVSRDWKVPHYEKMVVTNANLAALLLETYQIIRKPGYKVAAAGALRYLETTLHDEQSGLFFSSQDAWEEFYRLPWKDRETAEKPTVDRTAYTGWNAWAAAAFIKASGVLGDRSYLRTGAKGVGDAVVPSVGPRDRVPARRRRYPPGSLVCWTTTWRFCGRLWTSTKPPPMERTCNGP